MENSCFYKIRCFQEFSNFFLPKSWFNPFAKDPKWWLFETDIFIARKGLFYIKNITKHYLKAYFEEKWREKFSNFGTKIMGQPLCKKSKMAMISKVYLSSWERHILYQEHHNILSLSWAKVKREEFSKFWPKSCVNPFGTFLNL